ncbi:G/T mismatch-specific thymine DNA glycosylase [Fopius arisanus]|uniref:G/T mismatch-specific thymine DNA glycosylase n=1 Tax=Fopius arisanus TaxID=64838 RepID=A0A0C9S2C4_9HYME|nr:PREDICTED: G/T mismatch-specific thymine DNA glycosylase-like [Fopius arisanus]XP_011302318.1 PREDICTED: G/T mismatch-specific thymine DNA glycosylase-like [Fopius arisanus]
MEKRKKNRFNGLTEEEVKKNTLQDYLEPELDLVFLGINPSLMAAHKGRYYAGPGNHFYKLLHASELVPRFVGFEEDCNLLQYKIGLTNIVSRATRSSADLTTEEIRKGCDVVVEKMREFKPRIAVFNGKCIYQVFGEKFRKREFHFGLQSEKIGDAAVWVVPSSSARCSNFPRMEDKLHFYRAIKRHLMFLKGEIDGVDLKEFIFNCESRPRAFKSVFVVKEILGGSPRQHEAEINGSPDPGASPEPQDSPLRDNSGDDEVRENKEKGNDEELKAKLSDGESDFMSLIKRRISEKHDNPVVGEGKVSRPVKKLKYSNLKLRKS